MDSQTIDMIVDNLVDVRSIIIPILGDEVFYVETTSGRKLPVQEYLMDCFAGGYPDKEIGGEARAVIAKGGYYGLSKLERIYPDRFVSNYQRYMRNAQREGLIKIKPAVREFLEAFRFPLIVTTMSFGIIEEEFRSARYATRYYSPRGNNTAVINDCTVYHIFGLSGDGRDWVYDEDKLLEFLHSLHNADTSSIALKQYVDEHRSLLLALGCSLPDWIFRFLWYPLKSNNIDSKFSNGFWLNSCEISESFNDFLKNMNFFTSDQVDEILKHSVARLKELTKSSVQTAAGADGAPVAYDGFLSYASEDFALAERVYKILSAQGYRIWFDEDGRSKIKTGADYLEKIKAGVALSSHYIPLITSSFIRKITNSESNLWKETDMVLERLDNPEGLGKYFSQPLIVEGMKFNGKDITCTYVESMAGLGLVPPVLFLHKKMASYVPGTDNVHLNLEDKD